MLQNPNDVEQRLARLEEIVHGLFEMLPAVALRQLFNTVEPHNALQGMQMEGGEFYQLAVVPWNDRRAGQWLDARAALARRERRRYPNQGLRPRKFVHGP